jgi:hypothetical protein
MTAVGQDGTVFQARKFQTPATTNSSRDAILAMGAHSPPNSNKIGIVLLGCFDSTQCPGTSDVITTAAFESLTNQLANLLYRYCLSSSVISGHRDWQATACPGDRIYNDLPNIRSTADKKKSTLGTNPNCAYKCP